MSKTYVIKESTRQRCSVFVPTSSQWKQFRPVSLELFQYLKEAKTIQFSIYIRIGKEMIEYIKPKELSNELLQHIWLASQKSQADVDVYVRSRDFSSFNQVIDRIRSRKVEKLLERQPELDRKTLEVFQDLSGASQMVLRGGINHSV